MHIMYLGVGMVVEYKQAPSTFSGQFGPVHLDLDFADDLALLAHTHQQMQDKSHKLEITAAKTKVM